MSGKSIIKRNFDASIKVKSQVLSQSADVIDRIAGECVKAIRKKGKIIIFGNGGSAADSQHFAAELIGRFKVNRKALPAIALSTDTSIITSVGNDYGFDNIFVRQIEGLARKGDVAFSISTSGNSKNVIEAIKVAKKKGLKTISLTGYKGGKLAKMVALNITVPSNDTARIQETHILIIHCICELVEKQFLKK